MPGVEREAEKDVQERASSGPALPSAVMAGMPNSAVAAMSRSMGRGPAASQAAAALRRGDRQTIARLIEARHLEELEEAEDEATGDPEPGPVVARSTGLITADEAKAMGGGSPAKKDSGNYARIIVKLKAYERLKKPADAPQRKTLLGHITNLIAAWRGDATKRAKGKSGDAARRTILDRLETQIGLAMNTPSGLIEDPAPDANFRVTHDITFPTVVAYVDFLRQANQYTEPHFWTDPKVRFEHASRRIRIAYDPLELQEIYPGFRAVSQTKTTSNEPAYHVDIAQQSDALKQASKQAAGDFDFAPYDQAFGVPKRQQLTTGLSGKTQQEAVDFLLNDQKEGFAAMILSEQHGDAFHKKFLIDNMAVLKQQGVDTVYIELIRTEYQGMVDQFLSTPPFNSSAAARQMSPQLAKIAGTPSNGFTFDDLLFAAKEHGMRVVGIDGLIASKAPGAERAMTMNHLAQKIITQDRQGRQGGKYALLIGAAHTHTHGRDAAKGLPPVPGLAELLNIPAVKVDATGVSLHSDDPAKRA